MNEEQKLILVKFWIDKADSAIQDAKLLMENGRFSACVNRLYYSVFYAASAVLAFRGQNYGRHSAVRSAVHRDFVNSGIIDREYGRLYDILMSRREQADYRPAVVFCADEVSDYYLRAQKMVEVLKTLAA
jgi:uncharacterized protein (UPF0332 family)